MKTVFVGLSGGVDSSVAALRLQAQGYDVVGVFIKVWHPDWLTCNWEQERLDAMRVAAKLDIPFLTCDAEQAYKDGVADHFIAEYRAGRTPNPDVLCNQEVKFGAFLEFARARGADLVATGHYARTTEVDGTYRLQRGVDQNKDQSYFLWTLTQSQLKRILFPVGDTPKRSIRHEAEAAGLLTSSKKDSQGICFLGQVNIREFLSHYVELVPGTVLDEAGHVIGTHEGALVYTIGQRHGFTIKTTSSDSSPQYVIGKDLTANTITVSPRRPVADPRVELTIHSTNWIPVPPETGSTIAVQTRYRQTPFLAECVACEGSTATLRPIEETEAVAGGQSAVCYDGERCLGGGIIA